MAKFSSDGKSLQNQGYEEPGNVRLGRPVGEETLGIEHGILLKWLGAAHHHISYKNLGIIIDPLYTRLPGDKPHLKAKKEDLGNVDYLLLTHGHLDHSRDFADLALEHGPEVFAPRKCLADIEKAERISGLRFDRSKWRCLEDVEGTSFEIDDIEVTPYRIGTEDVDLWFVRSMFIRPWIHGKPLASATGLKWMTHHLFGACFAYHFRFPSENKTMLYFGNLTDRVDGLGEVERVDVLALPYCPANRKWVEQSIYLIDRFRPGVTMVHHFDNFMNPFTLSKYMNLDSYRSAILERCHDTHLYFSKFDQEVRFADIADPTREAETG
jgi:L-ascorbate metabolism protein UlaG (beta-lactamase superfamily)